MWDDVDANEAHEGDVEYRCFYIYNGSPTDTFSNVTIKISQKSVNMTDEVNLGLGTSAVGGVEQSIPNESAAPIGVNFIPVGHTVVIGNIPPAKWKAVWIRRKVMDHSQPMKDNNYIIRCQGKETQDDSIPPTPIPIPAPDPPLQPSGDTGGIIGQTDVFRVVNVYPSAVASNTVSPAYLMTEPDITTSDRLIISAKGSGGSVIGIPSNWYWPNPKLYTDNQAARNFGFPSGGAACGHAFYQQPNSVVSGFAGLGTPEEGWKVRVMKPDGSIWDFGDFYDKQNAEAYKSYLLTCNLPNISGVVTKMGTDTWNTKGNTELLMTIGNTGASGTNNKTNIFNKINSTSPSFWTDHTAHQSRKYILFPNDWKDVEITAYLKCKSSIGSLSSSWFEVGGRGISLQTNTDVDKCANMWYTGQIYMDGRVTIAKELGGFRKFTPFPFTQTILSDLTDVMLGVKLMIFNIEDNTKVKTELWLDTGNTNRWIRQLEITDSGSTSPLEGTTGGPSCGADPKIVYNWGSSYVKLAWYNMNDVDFSKVSVRPITFTPATTPTPPVTDLKMTIANSAITANGDDGNKPANVNDGRLDTRWSKEGMPGILTIDMGVSKRLSIVKIAWYRGNERVNTFTIQTSDNNSSWTTRFSGKSNGTSTAIETYNINPDVTCRYVRINVTANTQNRFASITEVELWGAGGGSGGTGDTTGQKDVFGTKRIYTAKSGGSSWASTSWNNGISRRILTDRDVKLEWGDPHDSAVCVPAVGDGDLTIHGNGEATFNGTSTRFTVIKSWTNVESTMYIKTNNSLYDNVDLRAKTDHYCVDCGSNDCFGGYISNFNFEDNLIYQRKEQTHDIGYTSRQNQVTVSGGLPKGSYIGIKSIIYNLSDGRVKIESWLDKTGGVNGGTWVKMSESIDSGGWSIDGKNYAPYRSATKGSALRCNSRDDQDNASYKVKNWTIQEINPP